MKKKISKKNIYWIAGVAVVLIIGYMFFSNNGDVQQETIPVRAGDFLQQVSVSGKIVSAQDVDLGFSQGGRVTGVYGDVGDMVNAGNVIAEVENDELRALVLQRQAILETQEARLRSLQDGARPESIAVAQATVDSALVSVERAKQSVSNSISDAYGKADDAVRNKVDQFITNPRTMTPKLIFTTTDSQKEINISSKRVVVEKDLASWETNPSKITVQEAQKYLDDISSFLSDAGSVLNKAVTSETVSQTMIDQYKADVSTARTSINATIIALDTAVTAHKSALSALDSARKNLALVGSPATASDIDTQKAQIKAAQADVQSALAQLSKTRITAPFSGVITTMDAKVGEMASPSVSLISLMGNNGTLQIESYIPEVNVSLVKVDDTAKITLDAYGGEVAFDAKVVSIDPAETIRDGVSTYRAMLELINQDDRIKSGMTANVIITTQKKSGVIAVPQGLVTLRDGKKFITVQSADATRDVEVTTGDVSSFGEIEILSGLVEGDVVLMPNK